MEKEYDEMNEEEIQQLKKKYEIMKENAETLAKRIDKAIENIEKGIFIIPQDTNELLNILKGEDKE